MTKNTVMPANAGIHVFLATPKVVDTRIRGHDDRDSGNAISVQTIFLTASTTHSGCGNANFSRFAA